jgi:hypothetical protein
MTGVKTVAGYQPKGWTTMMYSASLGHGTRICWEVRGSIGSTRTPGQRIANQSRAVVSVIVKANSEADKLPSLLALRDRLEELTPL